jgi:hypothetical protein
MSNPEQQEHLHGLEPGDVSTVRSLVNRTGGTTVPFGGKFTVKDRMNSTVAVVEPHRVVVVRPDIR